MSKIVSDNHIQSTRKYKCLFITYQQHCATKERDSPPAHAPSTTCMICRVCLSIGFFAVLQ